MGKGRIVSGGTDGLYTVELLHNRDRIDARLAVLEGRIPEKEAEIEALETERAEVEGRLDAAVAQLLSIIDQMQQSLDAMATEKQSLSTEIGTATALKT